MGGYNGEDHVRFEPRFSESQIGCISGDHHTPPSSSVVFTDKDINPGSIMPKQEYRGIGVNKLGLTLSSRTSPGQRKIVRSAEQVTKFFLRGY
jgi:hypothetical protein